MHIRTGSKNFCPVEDSPASPGSNVTQVSKTKKFKLIFFSQILLLWSMGPMIGKSSLWTG